MFSFLNAAKLKKEDLKGIAALMYEDVSDDPWDQENLTKRNLDFTVESIRYIDMYVKRLMNTESGAELLNKHFDNLVRRTGAYIGEVIRINLNQDFHWYDPASVCNYSPNLDARFISIKTQSVLYSAKRDTAISPLDAAAHYLKGDSPYSTLLAYTEETIKQHA